MKKEHLNIAFNTFWAGTVLKQGVDLRVRSLIGCRIFGQVVNKVGKIADVGIKKGTGFGKRPWYHTLFFGEYHSLPGPQLTYNKEMIWLIVQLKKLEERTLLLSFMAER